MADHFVRPDVAAFLEFLNSQPGPKMHEVSPDDARQMMVIMTSLAEEEVGQLAVIRDIAIPGPAGAIGARLFDARESREAGPVMVFFHGGGFVIGDPDIYASYCAEVARQLDMPVISIDYRLAPEHRFPAAAEDCEAAARWVAESPAELGYSVTGLILSGDSAGRNLTLVTAIALRDHPAKVPVILQHPIYPATSVSTDWQSYRDFGEGFLLTRDSMDWFGEQYGWSEGDWRADPLSHDQTNMPPTLITTASLDPLSEQGIAYAEKLRASGVLVEHRSAEGNIHGHITLRKAIPSSKDDVVGNLSALKAMLAQL
ncbi:MAG: alpha/beta hydrolase [Sphingomonadales bacterium]|nr:alpha/beta hydrolase [Sphingomonadales bacterium]